MSEAAMRANIFLEGSQVDLWCRGRWIIFLNYFNYKSDQLSYTQSETAQKLPTQLHPRPGGSCASAAALLKCRQLALAEKVFALKGLLLCFATPGRKWAALSHNFVCWEVAKMRVCWYVGSAARLGRCGRKPLSFWIVLSVELKGQWLPTRFTVDTPAWLPNEYAGTEERRQQ